MKIKKIINSDKNLIKQCDKLFIDFLESESKYDDNYLQRKDIKSFMDDLNDKNNILYSAIEDEKVIGFLFGYIKKLKAEINPVAHLCFLYVDPKYRNKKIATNLINIFLKEIKSRNINNIDVKVYSNNREALKLYKNLGFDPFLENLRKEV